MVVLGFVVAVPFLALLAAVPVAWDWGLSWPDVSIGMVAYLVSGLGVTALLHHVSRSINSICRVYSQRPFTTRTEGPTGRRTSGRWRSSRSGRVGHNSHHADPTYARHGALPGQLDPSARLIWLLEKAGWVCDGRWPKTSRFAALRQA
jgi:stearoyl-CoA desaturase (delta-9 desaturase)